MPASRDRITLAAFVASVLMGGGNAIGVRITVAELPPFWGATIRFGVAGILLALVAVLLRRPFPRGRQLLGSILYGVPNFGLAYFFLYWGLREATAGTAQVLLATIPLMTLLLAAAHGVERIRVRGLLGGLVAAAGIALIFSDRADLNVPLPAFLALLGGGVCLAEGNVLAKRFPPGDPIPATAVAMLVGGALLGVVTAITGETPVMPERPETWAAIAYLVVFGSIGVFVLLLFVLSRWTASAASFSFLLLPLVTVGAAAVVLAEPVPPVFAGGAVLVVAGVYVGAFSRSRAGTSAARAPDPVGRSGSSADRLLVGDAPVE
jgi:drug/metabolite transporter (DMT)-like permease